ncbi:flagellin [Campylobacter mucosalis]|uniref:Flagellin n=1 Tax=Campylobacter mucosalis CCUG 21559 TaxID=1032067 RepID=A0A6G5QGW9_9BACT|nr:flagellin [Campylobacter mucosalis]QCD44953.1 flagellar hook-associated protein [Campylobacter mucosalis CCUG 21559]
MRITNKSQHNQTISNYQRGMQSINKVREQISSGLKIQNSYENASVYNDGMRLDYEITTFKQVEDVTSKTQNFSKNSDKSLAEFSKQLENFKVKLVQAASDVHSRTSLEAIANDLQGIKDHLVNIANTSINGQFLFSGSAVSTKPISADGKYNGNGDHMTAVGGSQIEIPYNVPGRDIFLGRDNDYNKTLTTNVKLSDQTRPDVKENPKYLNEESKIRNLVGLNYVLEPNTINHDYDFLDNSDVKFPNTYFYLQGRRPDGTSFTSKFNLTSDASMRSLLDKIGLEFGNTATSKIVDVSMSKDGQIVVKDLTKGNHVIDFSLVGATEVSQNKAALPATVANANPPSSVADLATLEASAKANPPRVTIVDFTKNKYLDQNGQRVDSFDYDRLRFEKKDNTLTGNISQIAKKSGNFATDSTRLSEVAGTKTTYDKITYPKDIDPRSRELFKIDNQTIKMQVKSITGVTYDIDVKMGTQGGTNTPVQFTFTQTPLGGAATPARTISVYKSDEFGEYRTQANDFSYRQLMDIVAMAASDNMPNGMVTEPANVDDQSAASVALRHGNYEKYKEAVDKSKGAIEINLDHQGRIVLTDKTRAVTEVEFSMFDATEGGKFYGDSTGTTAANSQGKGSVFSFMENNAIAIDQPSIDIFADLQKMIEAVRNGGSQRADSESIDPRNTGLQGGIERIDHIMDHINKEKVKIGSYSNLLKDTNERASIMRVNISSVKSEIMDADLGEAYLSLTQRMMSYQAMLQSTAKINQLSLLNYL